MVAPTGIDPVDFRTVGWAYAAWRVCPAASRWFCCSVLWDLTAL